MVTPWRTTLVMLLPASRNVAAGAEHCAINFTKTRLIDARFLGLLVMLRKHLEGQRRHLSFTGVSPRIAKRFRMNGFGFLLHD